MRPSTDRTRRSRMLGGAGALLRGRRRGLVPLAAAAAVLALPAAAGAATVSGSAFEDFNDNGVRNTTPQNDAGVGGITVTAFGPGGAVLASGRTAADGRYSLNVPDPAGRVRIEFTDLPAGYQPARHGTRSGTTVQFADLSGGDVSGLDVGVLQPANFCQDNPTLALVCMQFGDRNGTYANAAAIRLIPDSTPDNTTPNPAGPGVQNPRRRSPRSAPSSASRSRPAPTTSTPRRTRSAMPTGVRAAPARSTAPTSTRPRAAPRTRRSSSTSTRCRGTRPARRRARPAAGTTTPAPGTPSATPGSATSAAAPTARRCTRSAWPPGSCWRSPSRPTAARRRRARSTPSTIPSPCVPAGDARPMGTAVHNGLVYVGGVCSMASVGDPPAANKLGDNRMRAYVYTFDPSTGTFSTSPVLDEVLESDRLCVTRPPTSRFPEATCDTGPGADWHPWTSQSTRGVVSAAGTYAQPMLSDIAFVGDDMVIGIRDRSPDQLGSGSLFPDGTLFESGVQSGYNLRACVTGSGTFALESNGVCGGSDPSGPQNIAELGTGRRPLLLGPGLQPQPARRVHRRARLHGPRRDAADPGLHEPADVGAGRRRPVPAGDGDELVPGRGGSELLGRRAVPGQQRRLAREGLQRLHRRRHDLDVLQGQRPRRPRGAVPTRRRSRSATTSGSIRTRTACRIPTRRRSPASRSSCSTPVAA